ncbi:virulence factor MviN-like protein [Bdellovibrio bacteriovorus W]|nr:virulence factor MviN-like protein [Bdellovibrio bacteriovorus W]
MKSHALLVAVGIFLSRIAGLVRERVFAYFFGTSDAGDAFKAALKIPNFLQNLFGEGVLSASFIPVYAEMLAKKHDEDAAKVASVVGSLLFLLTSALVLFGVLLSPWLIDVIAPGFHGEKKELTVKIVQILFPGTGFLVMSAWCLGILNSHKKFFLSYVAPVIWNLAIIASLLLYGFSEDQWELAEIVAWGLVAGSFLQFFVQLPSAMRLGRKLRPSLSIRAKGVPTVLKNFVPVVTSRGVVQVSAYVDNILASLLPTGAVSAIAYAQTLYLLPVSLFGMSVSAAELPTMSQAQGSEEEIKAYLQARLKKGLRQISFFIIPSVVGFVFLGELIVGAVFQTGAFKVAETRYVWFVLMGYTVGLLATTLSRLYSSTFYSLKDPRTPLKFAILRIVFGTALGVYLAFYFTKDVQISPEWGTPLLTLSAALAGWIEYFFLKHSLTRKIGSSSVGLGYMSKLWGAALISAVIAQGVLYLIPHKNWHIIGQALLGLSIYGLSYFVWTSALRIPEVQAISQRLRRRK